MSVEGFGAEDCGESATPNDGPGSGPAEHGSVEPNASSLSENAAESASAPVEESPNKGRQCENPDCCKPLLVTARATKKCCNAKCRLAASRSRERAARAADLQAVQTVLTQMRSLVDTALTMVEAITTSARGDALRGTSV
jgi:hypothetical protein